MMKTARVAISLIAIAVVAIGVSAGVLASDFPVLTKQVEVRQAHLAWTSAVQEMSMQAIVDYIDEISNGTGTDELLSHLENFTERVELIGTLDTHIALNNAIRQLIQITNKFRLEGREQMSEHDGRVLQLLARITEALQDENETHQELKDAYWETRKTNELGIFDTRVGWAQDILDILSNRSYNTTDSQAKLDEISAKRSDLELAYDERNNIEIIRTGLDILNLSRDLHSMVRDLQVSIPRQRIIRFWVNVGERVLERVDVIVSELEELGMDIEGLEEIRMAAEEDLIAASRALHDSDLGEAAKALRDLKTHLIELSDTYRNLVLGGDLPEDVGDKVESTSDAMDVVVAGMDTSL